MTDHGFVQSIYFFDPNGLRLAYTVPTSHPEEEAANERQAHTALRQWISRARSAHS